MFGDLASIIIINLSLECSQLLIQHGEPCPGKHVKCVEELCYLLDAGCDHVDELPVVPVLLYLTLY